MATARRHRKKSSGFKNFLAWIFVLAIFAGGIVFFVTSYSENTKNELEKLDLYAQNREIREIIKNRLKNEYWT